MLPNWNIAVTGGDGFIGSHLTEFLVKQGIRPYVITRRKNLRRISHLVDRITLIHADLQNFDEVKRTLRGMDVVFHLASRVAGIQYNIRHPAVMFEENVAITLNLLRASRLCDIKRLLIVSSTCVYPRYATVPTPESEGFLGEPEPTNLGYGWAKRFAEKAAELFYKEYGMKIAIVRPENVYGPRDNFEPETAHVIPSLIRRAYESNYKLIVWGSGKQTRSFIYVTDVVEAMCLAIEKYAVADPINIGSSEEITIGELAKTILDIMNKSNVKIVYDTSKPDGMPRKVADVTKMRNFLGFKPKISLYQGLKATIEWFLDNIQTSCQQASSDALLGGRQ
jgi:GDP-L-fucose synthase